MLTVLFYSLFIKYIHSSIYANGSTAHKKILRKKIKPVLTHHTMVILLYWNVLSSGVQRGHVSAKRS